MTTDLIERVARAIYDSNPTGHAHDPWIARSDAAKELFRVMARAAIGAMREPTEAMVEAAFTDYGSKPVSFAEEWHFIIDAALQPTKAEKTDKIECQHVYPGSWIELAPGTRCIGCGEPFASQPTKAEV